MIALHTLGKDELIAVAYADLHLAPEPFRTMISALVHRLRAASYQNHSEPMGQEFHYERESIR